MHLFNFISSSKISREVIAYNTFNKNYTNFKELRTHYKDEKNVGYLFDVFNIWSNADEIERDFSLLASSFVKITYLVITLLCIKYNFS